MAAENGWVGRMEAMAAAVEDVLSRMSLMELRVGNMDVPAIGLRVEELIHAHFAQAAQGPSSPRGRSPSRQHAQELNYHSARGLEPKSAWSGPEDKQVSWLDFKQGVVNYVQALAPVGWLASR